jgi:hypothetical protein
MTLLYAAKKFSIFFMNLICTFIINQSAILSSKFTIAYQLSSKVQQPVLNPAFTELLKNYGQFHFSPENYVIPACPESFSEELLIY